MNSKHLTPSRYMSLIWSFDVNISFVILVLSFR